jgi:hypothetical protein
MRSRLSLRIISLLCRFRHFIYEKDPAGIALQEKGFVWYSLSNIIGNCRGETVDQ